MHGGAAPQVARNARERIAALADPAVTELSRLIRRGRPDAVRLGAARDALDRAGYGAPRKVELRGRVELTVLRERLEVMGPARAERLAALLARPSLTEADAGELRMLRAEAGLDEVEVPS